MKGAVARQLNMINAMIFIGWQDAGSPRSPNVKMGGFSHFIREPAVSVGLLIIAHEPLATALKACCQHIYSVIGNPKADGIVAFDVPSDMKSDEGFERCSALLQPLLEAHQGVLILTDLLGATPSNIAHRFQNCGKVSILTGISLPGLLTAVNTPDDIPVNRVMMLAEAAARSGISSCTAQKENA